MKKAMILALLAAGGRTGLASAGTFGAGVVVGDPTGLTGKYMMNDAQGMDFGFNLAGTAAIYGDYLWHSWNMLPQPASGRLGAYLGAGPRVQLEGDNTFTLRALAGLAYRMAPAPVEFFLEAGPAFSLNPDRNVSADVGLGARFMFGPR